MPDRIWPGSKHRVFLFGRSFSAADAANVLRLNNELGVSFRGTRHEATVDKATVTLITTFLEALTKAQV